MHAPGRFQRSRLAIVTWAHFLNDCYGSFFAPILPLLIEKLSLSLTMASGLASIASITSAVFQPIYGMASDRLRGGLFIVIGPLLSTVSMSLIGVAPNAALVGVLLLLAGVGSAAFHPQAVAAAGAVSGERRGFGISVFIFGGSVGFALGPLAIIGAVHLWGLERSYYAMIPGLLSVFLLGLSLKVPTGALRGQRVVSLTAAFKGSQRAMALLFSIAVIREFTRIAVVTFLPIFLAMQGRSLAAGGITLALFSMAGALGGMVGGSLSDLWGRKTVILASGLLCVPLLHGMFHTDGVVSLLFLILAASTLSGANSVIVALAQELVPSRAGTASSLVMGLGWGVAGVLLIGFGTLAESIGVWRALSIAATLPLMTAVLAIALPKRPPVEVEQVRPAVEMALQSK
ncbi:MAG TPA: MFS transporter [Candidatus Tectomicrobia bacterium]|nr:MFS transporter [Candidatus Tectomicrobia bacterium]